VNEHYSDAQSDPDYLRTPSVHPATQTAAFSYCVKNNIIGYD